MNLRPRKPRDPDINLTPLVDAVFLLLIFFMVSTTFQRESQLQVELPEASSEAVPEGAPEDIEVTVDREGRFYVNQREVINRDVNTLKRALENAAKGRRDRPVLINADANTPHQAVITVMDAASQIGLVHIAFAARQPNAPRE